MALVWVGGERPERKVHVWNAINLNAVLCASGMKRARKLPAPERNNAHNNNHQPVSAIVDGKQAFYNAWPYVVSLRYGYCVHNER